jgi:excisionase family DNA binding protein
VSTHTTKIHSAHHDAQITEFGRYLYKIPEAMDLLSIGRSAIYEQIRSGRLRSVHQGRSRLISAAAIRDYVALLEREAQETVRCDETA